MSLSSHRLHALVSLAVLALCACSAPPPKTPKVRSVVEEPEQSAEWLFVAEQGASVKGPKEECLKVVDFISREKACTSALCVHARDLGKDWLRRCSTHLADRVPEVKTLLEDMERRAELEADACTTQAKSLLQSNECGSAEACRDVAQRWVSRCGERYATPLVLLMMRKKTERRFSEATSVSFDTRTCEVLQEKMRPFYSCDGEDACKEGVEVASAWKTRCLDEDSRPPMDAAIVFASVMVGANQAVETLAIDVSTERAVPQDLPLGLGDGKGTALWVCGERPKDLSEYIRVRSKCAPGEIIFARLDAAHHLKTVSVPHKSDEEFARLFPFLELRGERDAREKSLLASFVASLKQSSSLAQSKKHPEAIAKLVSLLSASTPSLARREDYRAALQEADGLLTPTFKEWGKAKLKAASKVRDATDYVGFVGRALRNPLLDMTADGTVAPGTTLVEPRGDFSQWLPMSFAAYQEALAPAAKEAKRRKLNEVKVSALRSSLATEIRACGLAEEQTQKALEKAAACLLGEAACPATQAVALSSGADEARRRTSQARKAVALILSSGLLPPAEVERYESEKVSAGCLDP